MARDAHELSSVNERAEEDVTDRIIDGMCSGVVFHSLSINWWKNAEFAHAASMNPHKRLEIVLTEWISRYYAPVAPDLR